MDTPISFLHVSDKRISLAPMIDWTTADFRYFARLFNPDIYLYTEMISTNAILQGNKSHLLWFDPSEHPVVLQLGGSSPSDMARCARIADAAGYDEININVGCPSDRVQQGKIGACLMAEPTLVADMVKAMQDQTDKPITVKHRIGIDHQDGYEFMHHFVETVAQAGCERFIVHARIAWLSGLSPKENRQIPPLRYDDVYRLKSDFPNLAIEINGGIDDVESVREHLTHMDGVMIGRAFYHNPMLMGQCGTLFGRQIPLQRHILIKLCAYLDKRQSQGANLAVLMRHYLGLFAQMGGSRQWRQALSGKKVLTVDDVWQAGERVLLQNQL